MSDNDAPIGSLPVVPMEHTCPPLTARDCPSKQKSILNHHRSAALSAQICRSESRWILPSTVGCFTITRMFSGHDRPTTAGNADAEAARVIARGSKSFALASRLLPERERVDASLVYSWCRYVDDTIDTTQPGSRIPALQHLRQELNRICGEGPLDKPLWEALREVLRRRKIPKAHLDTLLDGMQMDVEGTTYESLDELRLYCHRVAGVVGWLMVGVLGIDDRRALRPAAHLGIAMQLTNICRDVLEDWNNGRLYLPNQLLARYGAPDLRLVLGGPFPRQAERAVAKTVEELLTQADRHYRIGDEGLLALSARSATAVRAARLVYSAIGTRIKRAEFDVLGGRTVVPTRQKLVLLTRAIAETLLELPTRARSHRTEVGLDFVPSYPDDLLPW